MNILEHAITSWESLPAAGKNFASQVQKEVGSDGFHAISHVLTI